MNCPKCGFALTPLDKTCPRCVWVEKLPRPPARPVPQIDSTRIISAARSTDTPIQMDVNPGHIQAIVSSGMMCPVCASGDVQKVSSLVHGGTILTQTTGASLGAGHIFGGPGFGMVGLSGSSSVGRSELVAMLAPPPEPIVPKNTTAPVLGVCAFFGVPFLLLALPDVFGPDPSKALFPLGVAAIMALVAFLYWQNGERNRDDAMRLYNLAYPDWLLAMDKWEMLFFCGRCGCVFHLRNRHTASPREMYRLLQQ